MTHQPMIVQLIENFYIHNIIRYLICFSLFLLFVLIILIIISYTKNIETQNISYQVDSFLNKFNDFFISFSVFVTTIIILLVGTTTTYSKTDSFINNLSYDVEQIIVKVDFSKEVPLKLKIGEQTVAIIKSESTEINIGNTEEPYVVILKRTLQTNKEIVKTIKKLNNKEDYLDYTEYVVGQINY